MMTNPESDEKILVMLNTIARNGIQHAVEGLSGMLGEQLTATDPELKIVPILEVPTLVGGPENEVIGIYLRAHGKMSGQFMFIMPYVKALELVDMLMGEAPGTNTKLDRMGRSALAEVGNITGTYFLNEVATLTGLETKPTPPDVMVDMVAAILNVIVATSAEMVDKVVTIIASIIHGDRSVEVSFWYVPDPSALESLAQKAVGD